MQKIYLRALRALILAHHEAGAYGILLLGLPKVPVKGLLSDLGGADKVWASLVAAPSGDELEDWAHQEGWDETSFGADEDATHAVQVRNHDTQGAIRLVVAWRQEDRLHSLTKRGYRQLGPDEVIGHVALLGESEAPNKPQENLWKALTSEEVSSLLSLEGILAYYDDVFDDTDDDSLDRPRRKLPHLGLLQDSKLLTQHYASKRKIEKRLTSNFELIERIREARPEDRDKAHRNLQADSSLQDAYNALTRLRRGDDNAIADITYEEAERLIIFNPGSSPGNSEEETDPDIEDEESEDEGPRQYDNPAEAGLDLAAEGDHTRASKLGDLIVEHLGKDQGPGRETLNLPGSEIVFDPDARALALSRKLVGKNVFGGTLETEAPIEAVLSETGPYIEQFKSFDDVRIEKLKLYLTRAQDQMPEFEGLRLLEEYLQKRAVLAEPTNLRPGITHADVLASTTAAFVYLIAKPEIREAAREAVDAYVRLLSHMDARFQELSRHEYATAEGARVIYNEVLLLDLICMFGADESIVLLSPLNPLLLWKYLEVAELALQRGSHLDASDLKILRDEVKQMPEPLLALYVPQGPTGEPLDLVYAGRIGELSLYKPSTAEAVDASSEGIERASMKLATLYPPARKNLRVLLVGNHSLKPAARAAKSLVEKKGFEHVTLLMNTPLNSTAGGVHPPAQLDELHREGRVSIRALSPMGVKEMEQHFARQPVHVMVVARKRRRHGGMISKESTRLHPLSIPCRLETNPITNKISLQPRSNRAPEEQHQHPYGLYNDVVSVLSGKPHRDRTMREDQEESLSVFSPLLEYCQFCVTSGVPQVGNNDEVLRLTQGSGPLGDTVVTKHPARILSGVSSLIKEGNYVPSDDDVLRLLRRIEDVGGEGIFSTVSEKGVKGFSRSALQGQIGLAIALSWYQDNADGDKHLVLSLDGYLARQWLGTRQDGQRTDLLGFKETEEGDLQVDIIEVKSYASTSEGSIENSKPAAQLRSVAKVLFPMLRKEGQGDLLLDRRRELLRRQVFQEGLLPSRNGISSKWVETLNALLDGEREAKLSLTLIEVVMGENQAPRERVSIPESKGGDEIDQLPLRWVRLSEPSAREYLGGVLPPTKTISEDAQVTTSSKNDVAQNLEVETEGESDDVTDMEESHDTASDSFGSETSPDPTLQRSPPSVDDDVTETQTPIDPHEKTHSLGFEPEGDELEYVKRKAGDIYRALEDIGVSLAEAVDPELADSGPSIIRYKVRLRPGERVSSIQGRTRDLMRELAIEKEPMVDNLAGTNYVYIDLPRQNRRKAHLRPVIEKTSGTDRERYAVPVGAAPDGQVLWLPLTELPHMLVAGSTGSGKSMFLYTIITSLSYLHPPEDLQLVLVDPKRTDFTLFGRLPHLRGGGIITDAEKAVDVLSHLISNVMEKRTQVLEDALYHDIHSYNKDHPDNTIPPIFVVIDEFADLSDVIQTGTKEENFAVALKRLAQRARSVGIHLIVATQRPTTDVVDGTIKANLPCRVSFRLGSNVDSRTILDQGGAEHLLGKGDMLLRREGKTNRLQGFFLSDEDLRSVIKEIMAR